MSYEDRSHPSEFTARLQPINFELRDFTTGVQGGLFTFTGASSLGERIEWHGHLSVQPIESDGELRIDALRAHTIWEYLEDQLNFVINSGTDRFGCHVQVFTERYAGSAVEPGEARGRRHRRTAAGFGTRPDHDSPIDGARNHRGARAPTRACGFGVIDRCQDSNLARAGRLVQLAQAHGRPGRLGQGTGDHRRRPGRCGRHKPGRHREPGRRRGDFIRRREPALAGRIA